MAIKGRPFESAPATPEEAEERYQYVGPISEDDGVDGDAADGS